MGEKSLEDRIKDNWRDAHPRFKKRLADAWFDKAFGEFMDKLVSEGRAEHDAETNAYRIADEEFPTWEFQNFVEGKLERGEG